jgi:hypothetical protein
MQLHVARLCLDCQEIHAATHCPICTSASFVPLSKWVPVQERRIRPREASEETAAAFKRLLEPTPAQARSKWPAGAAALVATLGVGGWLWSRAARSRSASARPAGDPNPK